MEKFGLQSGVSRRWIVRRLSLQVDVYRTGRALFLLTALTRQSRFL